MTWLDISTAPRDGTRVLIYMGGMIFACGFEHGKWQHGVWFRQEPPITHWMPLPDPPSTTTESERLAALDGK